MATDLPALLTRLRAATGPDRTLDADICVALQYVPGQNERYVVWRHDRYIDVLRFDTQGYANLPALTGSIDAAVDLVERMLPGAALDLTIERSHSTASIWREGKDPETRSEKTAPLAILSATLEALMAREVSDE